MNSQPKHAIVRYDNLDILKAFCAFAVVTIHASFPGKFGIYFTLFCRIAVPIFFMISGFFYPQIISAHKEWLQIQKLGKLFLISHAIYFIIPNLSYGSYILYAIKESFFYNDFSMVLFFNSSLSYGHLWYLSAILFTLIIVWFLQKVHLLNKIGYIAPILLVVGLLLGKYSFLLSEKSFALEYSRNCYFIGLPFFGIGYLIAQNYEKLRPILSSSIVFLLCFVLGICNIIEDFLLTMHNFNRIGDIYICTIFLAILVFLFFLSIDNWSSPLWKPFKIIGRKYATWIYILHLLFIIYFQYHPLPLILQNIYNSLTSVWIYLLTLFTVWLIHSFFQTLKKYLYSLKKYFL